MIRSKEYSYSVLNSFTGAGANVTRSGGVLSVTNGPQIEIAQITNVDYEFASPELLQVLSLTFAATNNTTYSFVVSQLVETQLGGENIYKNQLFSYLSDATASAAEIALGFTSAFSAVTRAGILVGTLAGASSPLTLTAGTGSPNIYVSGLNNVSSTGFLAAALSATPGLAAYNTGNVLAPHGTPATAISGTTTVTVTFLGNHGLQPGDKISISGMAAFSINGMTTFTGFVATVPTATTITLSNATGDGGTNTGTLVIRILNGVYVTYAAPHGLTTGQTIQVSAIAGFLVDGSTSFIGDVYVGGGLANTVAKVRQVTGNTVTNTSAVATGVLFATSSHGLGSVLALDYAPEYNITPTVDLVPATSYDVIAVQYGVDNGPNPGGENLLTRTHYFFFASGAANEDQNLANLLTFINA